jgi:hypothetical protein
MTSHITLFSVKKLWDIFDKWKTSIIDINVNENMYDKILGILNPNCDVNIDFINFVNLCIKMYIRENSEKPLYACVLIEKVKELTKYVRNKKLLRYFEDVL